MTRDRLTDKESCKYLGLSEGTLAAWRSMHVHPIPYYKVGKRIFYKVSDLDQYLESCYVTADAQTENLLTS